MSGRRHVAAGDVAEWEKELTVNVHCPMIMTRMIAPGMAARHSGASQWHYTCLTWPPPQWCGTFPCKNKHDEHSIFVMSCKATMGDV